MNIHTSSVTMERIRQLRRARKLSLQEVADATNLSKSHICNLEKGHCTNPTIDCAVRISRALGCSLEYLTGLSDTLPDLHPEALRIAFDVDRLLRAAEPTPSHPYQNTGE